MTIEEKFEKIEEFFWNNFFYKINNNSDVCSDYGSNIPYQSVVFSNRTKSLSNVGDGTINLANLWTLLWMKEKLGLESPINLVHALEVYDRLVEAAYINSSTGNWYVEELGVIDGFFLRDDIPFHENIKSSLGMLEIKTFEDPCHSPFVSQDQVWNMNPILAQLTKEGNEKARLIGLDINKYIKDNGYTIYNPYLSALVHFYTYCPTFNEDKVAPWERQNDRDEHYKPNIKVKRGANNWYYSGGTKAAIKFFSNPSSTGGLKFNSLRELIYKGIVFTLDRIYEPIYHVFTGSDFKHNSYYCYAATSGIWYNKKFKRRFINKFNESIKIAGIGEPFEWNIAPLISGIGIDINISDLFNYLTNAIDDYIDSIDRFEDNKDDVLIASPIWILVCWYWYRALVEAKID